MLAKALLGAGKSAVPAYVEDVFSTWLYTGTGATQTITNGIDLAGKGGLTWIKGRSGATDHALYDTVRGATFDLVSNSTAAQTTQATGLTAFSSTGFSIGALAKLNTNAATYASWTFRKQPKFFDVVTFTGNGTSQTISHNLGSAPGCMIVKRTDGVSNWRVWHRGMSAGYYAYLDTTGAQINTANQNVFGNGTTYVDPTSTVFTVGPSFVSGTYVAYLFAHDAGGFGLTGTDNVISCGSFTATGNDNINLGYEPQWVLAKRTDASGNWTMFDIMRGMPVSANTYTLVPNTSAAETNTAAQGLTPTATGFNNQWFGAGTNIIYIAIRRGPMKTPTTGTSVFSPVARTGTSSIVSVTTPNFAPDLLFSRDRNSSGGKFSFNDKLRGPTLSLYSTDTAAEVTTTGLTSFNNLGYTVPSDGLSYNESGDPIITECFRRAPGFFDVVCYTGTSSARNQNHNLGVIPELIIVKPRTLAQGWQVWLTGFGDGGANNLQLNSTTATKSNNGLVTSSGVSSTTFSLAADQTVNSSLYTYVAYLFATLAGVSKVGSYTGNGSSQTIACGFTAGARFVMIKRTDSTGDWYVWDTARGIVSGNDPRLSLNTTTVEVTTDDTIDPDNSGFIVNQVAATNVNVTSATYIFWAVA